MSYECTSIGYGSICAHADVKCSLVWYMCHKRFLEDWLDLQWSSIAVPNSFRGFIFLQSTLLLALFLLSSFLPLWKPAPVKPSTSYGYYSTSLSLSSFSLAYIFCLISCAGTVSPACEWKNRCWKECQRSWITWLIKISGAVIHSVYIKREASNAWHWCASLQFDL